MNQTILQLPCTYVYYGQACHIRHNTKSSYETLLYHHHFDVLPSQLLTHSLLIQ